MTVTIFEKTCCFTDDLKIGDSVSYKNELYVVITLNITQLESETCDVQFAAQKVGSPIISRKYREVGQIVREQKVFNKNFTFIPTIRIGALFQGKKGIGAIVTNIESVHYDFTDLVVKYDCEVIQEWPNSEIQKAITNNRTKKFKVLQGGKSDKSL